VFFFRNFATETLWAGRNASRAPQGLNGIEAHETNL
jgi:hypothetical protein